MIGVDEEDDVGLSDLLAQGGPVLWACRGIDNGGCDIVGGAELWWNGDGREDWLDLVLDEDVLDE